jgi:mRNA interferase MazF
MKDFQLWHKVKEEIHSSEKKLYFYEQEVWFCSLGANVGFEQDGKGDRFGRPVVIVKKFNKDVFLGIPLTTKIKTGKYYFPIHLSDEIQRNAILSQIRLIDAKRLYQKIGFVSEDEFEGMKKALIRIIQ